MADIKSSQRAIPPLSAENKARLDQLAASGDEQLRRQVQVILLADQGLPGREIAREVGLSRSGVYYWLRRYREKGMALWDAVDLESGTPEDADLPSTAESASEPAQPPEIEPEAPALANDKKPVTIQALGDRYSLDWSHARHVAGAALRIFDATADAHKLSGDDRHLLESAALLHNIAYELDPSQHYVLGRDIILENPLEGLTDAERRIVAFVAGFHGKKVRPAEVPEFITLKKSRQRRTLALAALLRIADGLDYSHTQTSVIMSIRFDAKSLTITVAGDYAEMNVRRANKKGDLWDGLYESKVRVWPVGLAEPDAEASLPPLEPSVKLPEAGRVLLRHYLVQLERDVDLVRESGADHLLTLQQDISRILGVLDFSEPYYDATALLGFRKDMRWLRKITTQAIEARMLLARAHDVLPDLEGEAADDLHTALDDWFDDVQKAMRKLRKGLESKRYRNFLKACSGFTQQPGAGVFPGAYKNVSIDTRAGLMIWQELSDFRAELLAGSEVGILWLRARRFYNRLLFFRNFLGTEADDVLTSLYALATQLRAIALGEFVLAIITANLSAEKRKKKDKKAAAERPGIAAFRDAQQAWLDAARAELVTICATVDSVSFREKLALAIAVP